MNIYENILSAQKQKKDFALLTIVITEGDVSRNKGTKMLVFADGSTYGTIGGGAMEKEVIFKAKEQIKKGDSLLYKFELNSINNPSVTSKGYVEIFIDVHKREPKLVICGAGHVGKALCKIGSLVGFDIVVIDKRSKWGNKERFPEAAEILIIDDIEKAIEELRTDDNTYFVICTWGHEYDKKALKSIVNKECRYIGMLGGKTKAEKIFKQLIEEGIQEDLLNKVYTPIGLDLKAETPEEIALSILAEILIVKNNCTGKSLSFNNDNNSGVSYE